MTGDGMAREGVAEGGVAEGAVAEGVAGADGTSPMLGRPVADDEYGRLETFPSAPGVAEVELRGDELTALCPGVVGLQPDLYRWSIRYRPRDVCLETKSLRLYLLTFRNERIFAEHLAARIAGDVAEAVGAAVTVRLVQSRRGGVETAVQAFSPDATPEEITALERFARG